MRTGGGGVTAGATRSRGGGGGGRRRRRGLRVMSSPWRTARPPHGERPAREEEATTTGVRGPRSSQAAGGRAEAALRMQNRARRGSHLRGAALTFPYEDKARVKMSANFWSLGQINAPQCKT